MERKAIPSFEIYLLINGRKARTAIHQGKPADNEATIRKYFAMRSDLEAQGVNVSGPEIIERQS